MMTMRHGFTLIELVTVMAIITLLLSFSTPGVLSALHRARISESAERILQAHTVARNLARMSHVTGPVIPQIGGTMGTPHYAVEILLEGQAYVVRAILARSGDDPDMRVIASYRLPPGVVVRTAANPQSTPEDVATPLRWFYRYGNGAPILSLDRSDINMPIDIGLSGWTAADDPNRPRSGTVATPWFLDEIGIKSPPTFPGSPVCGHLEVADRQGGFRRQVVIMRMGLAHIQEPTP